MCELRESAGFWARRKTYAVLRIAARAGWPENALESTAEILSTGRSVNNLHVPSNVAVHGIFRKRVMSETESGLPYHEGMRQLQDRFQTRSLADRLDQKLGRCAFTDQDREFIASRHFFILATADAAGRPDCSYKGGAPGFARVCGDNELVFPSYDGNGMFRSLGNLLINAAVGLLFIDFERPSRLRVNGRARIVEDDPESKGFDGAQLIVRVRADRIFPNCPRYVHRMQTSETSPYVPRAGYTPPVPKWKRSEMFRDVLAPDDPARRDDTG